MSPDVLASQHSAVQFGSGRRIIMAVDDSPDAIAYVRAAVTKRFTDVEVLGVCTAEEALRLAAECRPGLVFLDLMMPDVKGFDLLESLLNRLPGSDIVLLTGHYSTDSAVTAIQAGASDYLTKPVTPERIQLVVAEWLERLQKQEHATRLEASIAEACEFEGIVGRSPAITDLLVRIQRIAPHFANVLVVGDTGTGKELVARVLHRLSPVRSRSFVVCNCAAIAETLFESELFGHVRGSFTGAYSDRKGLIEHAAGGTLFLDEIGEVPLQTQAKLLRFIQSREIMRIGDPSVRKIDVRIVAATNRDLIQMVAERKFREDLYYRLSMVELRTPPLAVRREDLSLLVPYFLKKFGKHYQKPGLRLSRRAMMMVRRYAWPGNVRELENALSYCAMVCQNEIIEVEDFPEAVQRSCGTSNDSSFQRMVSLEELQMQYIQEVLRRVGGNRAQAARILKIGRATLYRMLVRHDQDGERFEELTSESKAPFEALE